MSERPGLPVVLDGAPDGPEEGLLRAVAGGDAAAFEALYDRTADLVFGTVWHLVRDRAQAEEVAQEVFLEAWRAAGAFDAGLGGARSWLVTMARRRAIDRVRSARAASERDVRVGAGSAVRDYDAVSESVVQSMEEEQVRGCLGGLSDLQREAVRLAYYDGLTQREVAERLGVPLGTVKTRMRDGLTRLRDCLGAGE